MITERSFNISNLIRFLVIPVILVMTLMGGARLNDTVYDIINFGFDSKLSTLSSISGAFVKLEEHDVLIQPQMMHKIKGENAESLFALNEHGKIVNLYTDGSATLLSAFSLSPAPESILDFVLTDNDIIILTHQDELVKYDRSGTQLSSTQHDSDLNALGYSSESGRVFGVDLNGSFYSIDNSLRINLLHEINQPEIIDFTVINDSTFILLTTDQHLIHLNLASAEDVTKHPIVCGNDSEDCHELFSITYDQNGSHLWAISNQLLKMDVNGVIDWDHYTHTNFHDHTSELYLDYVIPMQKVREQQQLTYLYSFILNEEDRSISYVLDSSTDDDFTHIGYVDDELSEYDYQQAQQILLTQKTFVSEIKPWGQWGLVKIGFAPISDSNNKSGAVMGADLNVSMISQVSREALVILSLSSFFFLLLGSVASWYFSKTLTAPLLQLKDNVLGIAGGFLDKPILKPELIDLQPLADLFQQAGNKLKKEVVSGPSTLQNFEKQRRDQDLFSYLKLMMDSADSTSFNIEFDQTGMHSLSTIAYTANPHHAILWKINNQVNELNRFRIHQLIFNLAQKFNLHVLTQTSFFEHILNSFENDIDCLAIYYAKDGSADYYSQDNTGLELIGNDGNAISILKSDRHEIRRQEQLSMLVLSDDNEKRQLKISLNIEADS